jgi:quercetin dioxygenase-like cupin family protein
MILNKIINKKEKFMYLEVFKPEKLINFNSANYEKKILWEEDESKIIIVALEKEQEIPEHFSPIDAVAFVLKGKIDFIIENENYTVKDGEMIIIPAKTSHKVVGKDKSKFIICRL